MSTLKDYRNDYYVLSARASENARQFAFAGIALIWILKVGSGGVESVPQALYFPALLFALTLAFDFFHYVSATAIWGVYTRRQEKAGRSEITDFKTPRSLNWPALAFFVAKQITLGLGYISLGLYLCHKLNPGS